jgi:hypothetical protein
MQNPPQSPANIYSKLVNIIKRLLVKSKYVKLVENTSSLEMAQKEIPVRDQ